MDGSSRGAQPSGGPRFTTPASSHRNGAPDAVVGSMSEIEGPEMPRLHPDGDPARALLHAWVDERMDVDGRDGRYTLAAVISDPAGCEPMRAELRALRLRRQPRLHWRDEDISRRTKIAAAIGAMDVAAVVVVGTPMIHNRQERARRICMERLLPLLEHDHGVSRVVLEARTPSLIRKDHQQVLNLMGKRWITRGLTVAEARPSAEPMLWIADAVAGATGAAHTGNPQWLEQLDHLVTLIPIEIR